MWIRITILTILFIFLGVIHNNISVNAANIRCYDGSFDNFTVYSFNNAHTFLTSSSYRAGRTLGVYTFGFQGSIVGNSVKAVIEAYLSLSYNACAVDWEKEASSNVGDVGYPRAVYNAINIGKDFCGVIQRWFAAGLSRDKIQLDGFSLGAMLMAYAAKECKNRNATLPFVRGLDPAGPLFDGPLAIPGLESSDADYVEVLHTNPGRLGTDESRGHVDIWANCGNPVQPGCRSAGGGIGLMTPENLCSHNRSWEYFSAATKYPDTLIASDGSSCSDWYSQGGGDLLINVETNKDTGLRGNFYLITNAQPPYGKGVAGASP